MAVEFSSLKVQDIDKKEGEFENSLDLSLMTMTHIFTVARKTPLIKGKIGSFKKAQLITLAVIA